MAWPGMAWHGTCAWPGTRAPFAAAQDKAMVPQAQGPQDTITTVVTGVPPLPDVVQSSDAVSPPSVQSVLL